MSLRPPPPPSTVFLGQASTLDAFLSAKVFAVPWMFAFRWDPSSCCWPFSGIHSNRPRWSLGQPFITPTSTLRDESAWTASRCHRRSDSGGASVPQNSPTSTFRHKFCPVCVPSRVHSLSQRPLTGCVEAGAERVNAAHFYSVADGRTKSRWSTDGWYREQWFFFFQRNEQIGQTPSGTVFTQRTSTTLLVCSGPARRQLWLLWCFSQTSSSWTDLLMSQRPRNGPRNTRWTRYEKCSFPKLPVSATHKVVSKKCAHPLPESEDPGCQSTHSHRKTEI